MLSIKEIEKAALEIRKDLLTLCSMQTIHIGGDLSVADVMTVLWQYQMKYNPNNIHDENRDRFILSKSHASAVTSFNQAAVGCFDREEIFKEYATDGGRFSMHSCNLINPYVEVSTGSLGHGLPIGCGIAQGIRLKGNDTSRVYVVLGDGELTEGSIWEAAMNAAHYKLGNVVAIIDNNGLSNDGSIEEFTGLGNIATKFQAFGWNTVEIDGHDVEAIEGAFNDLPPANADKPNVIVCHTVKGKGVAKMENNPRWHAGRITEEECREYVSALEDSFNDRWSKL